MAESSFPVLEQPLTDQQWGQVTAGIGSGVLGRSSGNYAYAGVNNAANTAVLQSGADQAQAIVGGFYHRIDSNHTISLPAIPSGSVTYFVGLTYDPLKHADPNGPVSITVTTTKPSGSGKVYLPLYEVVRQANQLLTDAVVRVRRVLIAATLSVAAEDERPDPTTLSQGTICQTTNSGTLWRVFSGSWVPVSAPSLTSTATMERWDFSLPSGGIEVNYLGNGRRRAIARDVVMRRSGISYVQGTAWTTAGTFIPSGFRGADEWRQYQATVAMGAAAYPAVVQLNTSTGALRLRLGAGSQTISPGHEVLFSASWVIA